jgi:hypothetical protein
MYLGGPAVWGAWVSMRLEIMQPSEFLACLLPWGVAIGLAFLAAHLANAARPQASARVHCALVTAFGTMGTFGFLALPASSGGPSQWIQGALAGASLVGLFFPFFSIAIFDTLSAGPGALAFLYDYSRISWLLGLACYVASVLWSGAFSRAGILGILGLAFPLSMSAVLLWKSARAKRMEMIGD